MLVMLQSMYGLPLDFEFVKGKVAFDTSGVGEADGSTFVLADLLVRQRNWRHQRVVGGFLCFSKSTPGHRGAMMKSRAT